jgi:hypothetical protein
VGIGHQNNGSEIHAEIHVGQVDVNFEASGYVLALAPQGARKVTGS